MYLFPESRQVEKSCSFILTVYPLGLFQSLMVFICSKPIYLNTLQELMKVANFKRYLPLKHNLCRSLSGSNCVTLQS